MNSGQLNSGQLNSGQLNSGQLNSGQLNSGQLNSGQGKQLANCLTARGEQLKSEQLIRSGKPVSDYKELIAYQKAYELVLRIYQLTDTFPKEEVYGLTSQIRRAAVSIPSNIAEGFMRGSREYLHFLKIALGSAAELETQLSLSKDLGYCGIDQFNALNGLTKEVLRLLTSYISKMKQRQLSS